MKALLVKFLAPTNTKPARLKATIGNRPSDGKEISVVASYHSDILPNESSNNAKEKAIALILARSLDWGWTEDNIVSGGLPNGDVVVCYKDGY